MPTIEDIQPFLNSLIRWAEKQPDIQSLTLLGSYARNAARLSSDIDIFLLVEQPENYLENIDWTRQFGQVDKTQVEYYGKVTSLRVWYRDLPEVEFGLSTPDWAAQPLDEGTRRVIEDGILVLYERSPILELLIH